MNTGDYVLATKYSDGHPQDHWAIGFYKEMLDDRYIIVDQSGIPFRANGFRRAKKISKNRGAWILKNKQIIESSNKSLWSWLTAPMYI